ncbi:hydroxypyruvate isomerase [Chitinophaga terrae (ex Kim and Jung 2007)]|uniref:Hydroxypyruvate isomerase n=1 Tax=Chitinophaga terrae (ex Kim and Jung 2007) TaxID=408074 RepID=A0A1H4FS72_9BACT|nr:TIM barrel protein [Chitinophaga terrae (ex Kim and Jung 2007)]MDQ0105411.1 hydroxypyruvate isomerase [Chitinophaga terrae (ex Kim and Jung 2007)]SEB00199.1 hydroxypyruvate isomerase [Chitinophaga terrae (ex Kim and Jung 2007)]
MNQENSRRNMIKKVASAALATTALSSLSDRIAAHDLATGEALKGKINHSVCAWCYDMPLEELCVAAKQIGIPSIDLVSPHDFKILKKYNMHCAMVSSNNKDFGITNGFNNVANHDKMVDYFKELIDATAAAGFTNLICFSGNRNGMDDMQGLKNCARGIHRVIGYAEKKKVNLVMELLNSRVNHPDYQCDHTAWGVELCKHIASDNFKLLYDIYHMQIMDGDIIHHIRDYHQYFAHYHTGGVPGRHEIDNSQELNYPAIMKAIYETGYKGYVAQEFVPSSKDKKGQLASLQQAVKICDLA